MKLVFKRRLLDNWISRQCHTRADLSRLKFSGTDGAARPSPLRVISELSRTLSLCYNEHGPNVKLLFFYYWSSWVVGTGFRVSWMNDSSCPSTEEVLRGNWWAHVYSSWTPHGLGLYQNSPKVTPPHWRLTVWDVITNRLTYLLFICIVPWNLEVQSHNVVEYRWFWNLSNLTGN